MRRRRPGHPLRPTWPDRNTARAQLPRDRAGWGGAAPPGEEPLFLRVVPCAPTSSVPGIRSALGDEELMAASTMDAGAAMGPSRSLPWMLGGRGWWIASDGWWTVQSGRWMASGGAATVHQANPWCSALPGRLAVIGPVVRLGDALGLADGVGVFAVPPTVVLAAHTGVGHHHADRKGRRRPRATERPGSRPPGPRPGPGPGGSPDLDLLRYRVAGRQAATASLEAARARQAQTMTPEQLAAADRARNAWSRHQARQRQVTHAAGQPGQREREIALHSRPRPGPEGAGLGSRALLPPVTDGPALHVHVR